MEIDNRNYGLDLLRGLCACAVAGYHFLLWQDSPIIITSLGTFGVYVFFILSSLTMMLVYGNRFADGLSREEVTDFFRKRCARILPLLATAAAIALFYNGTNSEFNAKTLLTGSALMFMGLPGYHSIATGAWSLGIEFAFYVVFPLVALMVGRRVFPVIIATIILTIAQQASLHLVPIDGLFVWTIYTTPITFAPFFALGILIYLLRFPASKWNFPIGILILAMVLFYSMLRPLYIYNGGKTYVVLMLLAAVATMFFFRTKVPKFLVSPSEFLGKISYSLYLTHWMWFKLINFLLMQSGAQNVWLHAALFVLLSLLMSYAIFAWFENPLRKLLSERRSNVVKA